MRLNRRGAGPRAIVSGWLIVLTFVADSRADRLYFAKGGRAQLPVERSGGKVVVHGPDGTFNFLDADFLKIVPDEPLASGTGLAARFAEAWKALETGRVGAAVTGLRETRAIDPKHEPTATLVRTLDRIMPALDDPEAQRVRSALRLSFREARSPHYLLFHMGTERDAEQRLNVLEDVYTSYYLVMAAQGIDLSPPRRRLMCALFTNQQSYMEFLGRGEARAFTTTQGFFHPTLKLVVTFDPSDLPQFRNRRRVLDRQKQRLDETRKAVDQMPTNARLTVNVAGESSAPLSKIPAQAAVESLRRDLDRQTLLLDLDRRSIDIGMAAHEATHQLVDASALAPRHDDFPTWLHEGLAAQFEVIRSGRWAGVSRANDLRLPEWRAIHSPSRLARLIRDPGYGRGYDRDLYAEYWALVYFLTHEHPKEFTRFLDALRTPSQSSSSRSDRVASAFRKVFGDDLSDLDAEWHRFMRSVSTPLEDDSPPNAKPR